MQADGNPGGSPGLTASAVAAAVGGVLLGPDRPIAGICTLDRPRAGSLGFVTSGERLGGADPTADGVILLATSEVAAGLTGSRIAVPNPRAAFGLACQKFFAQAPSGRIAETARIHPTARIGPGVTVGEYCVVGANVTIGEGTELRHHVTLAANVRIGARCLIRSHAVIGEEGFGMEKDGEGRYFRIPHFGGVWIGDDVEIGASATIAGGTVDPTEIHDNAKIDDQVFIAHNCVIGENTLVIACTEISGSNRVGRDVWIGPNCTTVQGVTIGDGAYLGAATVVTKSLEPGGLFVGSPARLLRPRTASD